MQMQPLHFGRAALGAMLACVTLLPVTRLQGQTIFGVLTEASGRPAVGVQVVATAGPTGRMVARAVTSRTGSFRLESVTLPVRLRALRIGFAPVELGVVDSPGAATAPLRLRLPDAFQRLAPVRVTAERQCGTASDPLPELADAIESARQALTRIDARIGDEEPLEAWVVLRNQVLDVAGVPTSVTTHRLLIGESLQPFRAVSPQKLLEDGFVEQESDGVVYHGPDAEFLASDEFLRTFCFSFGASDPERASWIGIRFAPMTRTKDRVSVEGVLWIDRVSRRLQLLEFTYVGLPPELDDLRLGGRVHFEALPNGLWFVSRWSLRIARTFVRVRNGRLGVEALLVTQGDVVAMQAEGERVFEGSPTLLERAVVAERDGERFWESDQEAVATSARLCEDAGTEAPAAGVYGIVYAQRPIRLANSTVVVQWRASQRDAGGQWREFEERRETRSDADGFFRLCGLPADTAVDVIVSDGAGTERSMVIRTPPTGSDRRLDVEVRR